MKNIFKKHYKFKKIIVFAIVFAFGTNSLAATVSDNDGTAFITKTEFDSLKNNFQTEMDQYYTNIDSKIDAAIASYLAGIKVETKVDQKDLLSQWAKYPFTSSLDNFGYTTKKGDKREVTLHFNFNLSAANSKNTTAYMATLEMWFADW